MNMKKTDFIFQSFLRRQTVCCLSFCGLVTMQTEKYSFVNDKCRSCSRGVCWTMVWAKYWKVQQFLIEPFARVLIIHVRSAHVYHSCVC